MRDADWKLLLGIGSVAVLLLLADRNTRISPILLREGFRDWSWNWGFAGQGPQRCGVELAPCPHPFRCINGFCRSQDEPAMVDRNPLPVLP